MCLYDVVLSTIFRVLFWSFYFSSKAPFLLSHLDYFLGGAPAADSAFLAIFSAMAFASASFFCAGVKVDRSPGFGAAGTAFLCP